MIKLHLGCGTRHIDGYINIDCQKTIATDMILDIKNLSSEFKNNTVDGIYCCHVLEHMPVLEAIEILKQIYDILKPGGIVRIAVPNFKAIVTWYQDHGENLDELHGLLYGRHDIPFEGHYTIWDFKRMYSHLDSIGFKNIFTYDWRKTEHANLDDFSQAYLPHFDKENGLLMSLNVKAEK